MNLCASPNVRKRQEARGVNRQGEEEEERRALRVMTPPLQRQKQHHRLCTTLSSISDPFFFTDNEFNGTAREY